MHKSSATFILLLLSFSCFAQLIDCAALDTTKTYTLEQALRQKDHLGVYKLSLNKLKLTELPPEIYQFKNVQHLIISKNKLKEFPKEITQFKYLQILDISSNRIEIVPKELGELIYLKEFYANQNKIVSIPPEIKNLKQLTYLDLWGNDIGVLPHEISELKNSLKEIDMRVILMSAKEHKKIKELLPDTKIRFSKSCDCGF
ncbi:MAG: leucine-rich repeat domain-containing protein [Vicingus serpentipes]|nr:leucine-rich repeat domain-containing protein [Vicingus serpentipes]